MVPFLFWFHFLTMIQYHFYGADKVITKQIAAKIPW